MARRTGTERKRGLVADSPPNGRGALYNGAGKNGADPAAAPGRVLQSRRRALPTGRAVLGAFLVAVAAVVVFTAALATARPGKTGYVSAAQTLAPGSVIGPGDLAAVKAQLPAAARSAVFTQASSLFGRTLAVTVPAGELIESSMLVTPGTASLRPISVAVDPDSLEGLASGDSVDVLASTSSSTSSSSGSSAATVTVVMRGASLISINEPSSSLVSGSDSGTIVTLGVGTLAEVEAVVAAAHSGTIILALAEASDGVGAGPG